MNNISRKEAAQLVNAILTPTLADLIESACMISLDDTVRAALLAKADEVTDNFYDSLDRHYPE